MKTQLTKEQVDKLIELNVPEEKLFVDIPHRADYDTPNVIDLLEILPKEIKDERLCIGAAFLNFYALGEVWVASYEFLSFDSEFMSRESQELIDSLYELLLWTIESGYLKFE